MDPPAVGSALAKFGIHVPIPSIDFLAGPARYRAAPGDRCAARHL